MAAARLSDKSQATVEVWEERLQAEMKRNGCSRTAATSAIVKRDPELHRRYLLAVNEGRAAIQASINARFGK